MDFPVPRILEAAVEMVPSTPQVRVQNRTLEQIVDVPMNTADYIVTVMNIPQIIECFSPFSATLEILFCLFRT